MTQKWHKNDMEKNAKKMVKDAKRDAETHL